jgi:hypothetical protein
LWRSDARCSRATPSTSPPVGGPERGLEERRRRGVLGFRQGRDCRCRRCRGCSRLLRNRASCIRAGRQPDGGRHPGRERRIGRLGRPGRARACDSPQKARLPAAFIDGPPELT